MRRDARPLCRRRHPDFFNDPLPIAEPGKRAAKSADDTRLAAAALARWPDLALGSASPGFATLGAFGSRPLGLLRDRQRGQSASRLSDEAQSGQVLIDRRTRAALGDTAEVEPVGPLTLKGYSQPVTAFVLKDL